jgi:hypothetical protein
MNDETEDRPPRVLDGPDDAPVLAAPLPERDIAAECKAIVLAARMPLTLDDVHTEIKVAGYVAEGPVRTAMTRLVADGALAERMFGDPLTAHYCAPTRAPDVGMMATVCMEMAALPDDRDPRSGLMTAFDINAAIERRCGTPYTDTELDAVLDKLVKAGVFWSTSEERALPAPEGEEASSAWVTLYGFAPGLLFNLLRPAFTALLTDDAAPKIDDALPPAPDANPDHTAALAAVRAAVVGAYTRKLEQSEARTQSALSMRDDALRQAADAMEKLDTARRRARESGLHDLFDTLTVTTPEHTVTEDPRGEPIRYERRIPMTPDLKGQFWDKSVEIREKIRAEKAREALAKKTYEQVKVDIATKILGLEATLDDMGAASRANTYLQVVERAYKEMERGTRRVGVYNYDTGELVCWDDPYDLPPGAQPALPGLDAHDPATGTQPATAPKGPKRKRAPTGDGAAPAAVPEASPPAAPAAADAPPTVALTLDERVLRAMARGNGNVLLITVALNHDGTGDAPAAADVEAALQRLAATDGPTGAAAAEAIRVSGVKATPEPVAAVDEAAAASATVGAAQASEASAVTPIRAPMRVGEIKRTVAEMVKGMPAGILWSTNGGSPTLTDAFKAAYCATVNDPQAFKAPSGALLVAGAVSSQITNKVLAEVITPEGRLLYHPDNGEPGATPERVVVPDDGDDEETKAAARPRTKVKKKS